MTELERLFYKSRGTYRRLKVAIKAARERAQRAEARAWGYGRAYTELLERYERNTIGGRGIAELTEQLAAAIHERDELRGYLADRDESLRVRDWQHGQRMAALRSELEKANAAFDELSREVKLATHIEPNHAPSLDGYIRTRYARERDQWKANHDQRKAERDAARADIDALRAAVFMDVWPALLARNLRDAAALRRAARIRIEAPAT